MKASNVLLLLGLVGAHALVCRPILAVPASAAPRLAKHLPLRTPLAPLAAQRARAVVMQEAPFWENVGKFARFGITAGSGLIAGLLAPFSAFLRTPTLMAIGSVLLTGVLVFFYLTLQAMFTAPEIPTAIARPDLVLQDPQMKSMLSDIYGP